MTRHFNNWRCAALVRPLIKSTEPNLPINVSRLKLSNLSLERNSRYSNDKDSKTNAGHHPDSKQEDREHQPGIKIEVIKLYWWLG